MQIRGGDVIDAIRVKYGSTWGPWHGGDGGEPGWSFELNSHERIVKIKGTGSANHFHFGNIIATIEFHTKYKIFGPYGNGDKPGENHQSYWESSGGISTTCELTWIAGDSGNFIKSLSFNYNCGAGL